MTLEIGFLLLVLAVMVVLFLTEKLPIDLTAFLGLVVLIFTGYVTPSEAFDGFASPAVITMLSIFIVSAALLQTGVADSVGGRIHRWVGSREVPLLVTVMLTAGILSAFMNNIAATAVLMPAVASLGRSAGLAPSRLFMPLAFGAILGGTTTLVGTPPNILAGAMLQERGLESFALFDFAPLGLALLASGILYMVSIGRRLLPQRDAGDRRAGATDLAELYRVEESLFTIRIPKASRLDGVTLEETGIGESLGVQIVAVIRDGRRHLAPTAETTLHGDDELLVQGSLEDLRELLRVEGLDVAEPETRDLQPPKGVAVARLRVTEDSWFVGKSLEELEFRQRFGVIVVALQRGGEVFRERLATARVEAGDVLVGLGNEDRVGALGRLPDVEVEETGSEALRSLGGQLFVLTLPSGSPLVGTSVARSRMRELMGLTIVAIVRGDHPPFAATPGEMLEAGDRLLVSGEKSRVRGLLALGEVRLEGEVERAELESDDVGVIEATVAPRSTLIGRSLRQISFRDRYGVSVLGIWRDGKPLREGLADLQLRVGDGLLLQGPRDRLRLIAEDRDFVVLSEVQPERRTNKAGWALAGLGLMIALVISGWQPIQVAAFTAASLTILSGALTMEEAYRAIEWRAIFLVAAVLPVGGAMERSGAAELLARGVVEGAGPLGPYAVLGSLIVLSSLLSQGLDGAPAVVLLTPVVLQAAEGLGVSPYPLMMGVSLAASAAFMTPFSHKANLLVMGLGGYRSADYLRVGTPLTAFILVLMTVLVPVFFPF
jgi:di/tricarboxylate transporter